MQIVEKQLFAFKMLPICRREKTAICSRYMQQKKARFTTDKNNPFDDLYNKLIRFYKFGEVQGLINTLTKNIIK